MALLNAYVLTYGQVGKLLEALRKGQAPDKFNRQHLKDIGFTSSNHHAFIPLLKGLGFLSTDGTPTQRYKDYLGSGLIDHSQKLTVAAMQMADMKVCAHRSYRV